MTTRLGVGILSSGGAKRADEAHRASPSPSCRALPQDLPPLNHAHPSGAAPHAQSAALLRWYAQHEHDRRLPWRAAGEPHARRCLVEGLLAQTRAEAVADHYARIFRGVLTASDWALTPGRTARVALLGLPRLKRLAMDSIAACLLAHQTTYADLIAMPGVGPYIAAMVAALHGAPVAPVDCNVARVAARLGAGDAEAWIGGLMATAAPGDRYALVSAVLDVGATLCTARGCDGEQCPLESWCGWQHKVLQTRFFFAKNIDR